MALDLMKNNDEFEPNEESSLVGEEESV